MNNIELKPQTALITGAAGYIGSALALELARTYSHLILVDINENELNRLKNEISINSKVNINIHKCDMSNKKDLENLADDLDKKYSVIDAIFNAIGMVGTDTMEGWNTDFTKHSYEAWQKCLDVNVSCIFFLIQKVHHLMKKSPYASIVNISSIYGVTAPDWSLYEDTDINNPAAYSVSKAGLVHMTKWLASKLAPEIRVNCISPGGIKRNQEKSFIEKYESKTPLKRMATEEDIIGPAIFLASTSASYITGENLIVDGGWTIT